LTKTFFFLFIILGFAHPKADTALTTIPMFTVYAKFLFLPEKMHDVLWSWSPWKHSKVDLW